MTVEPKHVYARMALVHAEIELVRQEMGRAADRRTEPTIANAAPREVYFEALALFRKADRLCFERTGEQALLPHPPAPADLEPADVRAVVDAVLERVRTVKQRIGATEAATEPGPADGKTPSDVLLSVMRASRQLNVLVDQSFSPNDVYQQVSLALGYATRLAARAGGSNPSLPAAERKKRPADVYRRLAGCLATLHDAMAAADLSSLDFEPAAYADDEVLPSDVYDLSSLVISELAYLHSLIPGLAPPSAADVYEFGHKLPSHVYQLAGALEAQIAVIASKPDLLKAG
jgi:hypothetical protein